MRKIREENGFTLVELMIVLSIIAILAVVLIPRVGNMRDSAREQGVQANINSVRAYLEFRSNDRDTNTVTEEGRLLTAMRTEFAYDNSGPTGNAIVNPFTDGYAIDLWDGTNLADNSFSVIVQGYGNTVNAAKTAGGYLDTTRLVASGKVVIMCCTDGYLIFGYDAAGDPVPFQIVY